MSELPRVMRDIVGPLVLGNEDKFWLKPKFLRRGRLVEAAVTLLAQGKEIEPEWWGRHSGESEEDRVAHEDTKPYIEGGRKFLAEVPCELIAAQRGVVSREHGYQGHIDWYCNLHAAKRPAIVDLKCGPPPSADSSLDYAYRMQLALYAIALAEEERFSTLRYLRLDLHLFDGTFRLVERRTSDIRDARTLLDYYALSRKWSKA